MSDVKRYRLGDPIAVPPGEKNPNFVLASDYDALVAQLESADRVSSKALARIIELETAINLHNMDMVRYKYPNFQIELPVVLTPPSNTPRTAFQRWVDELPDEEPNGCIACGAIAGTCSSYPNCPGGLRE